MFRVPRITYRSTCLAPSRSYAFVEFRSQRHAEDAYYDMYVLSLARSLVTCLTRQA